MYVDAYLDRKLDRINIVERINGERKYVELPAKYSFYYEDKNGKYLSIYGDHLSKFETGRYNKFKRELDTMRTTNIRTFESDTNPLFRCLSENYRDNESPNLNISFFDIEVDFDPDIGYSKPTDAFSKVTSITVYNSWTEEMITLVIPPPTLTFKEAYEICNKFENTIPIKDEEDLLLAFIELIEDADVITGWNSEFYDLPYLINRIKLVLGSGYVEKLSLWGHPPKESLVEKFGKEEKIYDLVGRVHLDYLELFKKHSGQEYHSYSLDFIGKAVVKEKKVPYEGSLDKLYKQDFEKFIAYNRQDVGIIVKIDNKMKFIELANQVAHSNGVLLKTTMGSVALIDQAILNEAHRRGLIVHDKKSHDKGHLPVAGAYVANPQKGIHEYIGAVDINSLYPSTIRALNMCSETIFGQISTDKTANMLNKKIADGIAKNGAEAWNDQFGTLEFNDILEQNNEMLTLTLENGEKHKMTAKQVHDFIFESENLCISANGTIFTTDVQGIIPGLLGRWYAERQIQQNIKHGYEELQKGIELDSKLLNRLYGGLSNEEFNKTLE